MKNLIRHCAISTFLITLPGLHSAQAAPVVYNVNDWYATATNAERITAGDTHSPTVVYTNTSTANNYSSTALWSYFTENASPITLADGETLVFSAGISVNFNTASSRAIPVRFALLDSSSPRATTDGAGGTFNYTTDRIGRGSTPGVGANGNARNGWSGVITHDTVSSGTSQIYQRDSSVSNVTWSSTGSGVNDPALMSSGIRTQTFNDGTALQLLFNVKRAGDDLELFGTWGSESFAGTYTDFFTGSYPDKFDAFGFFVSGQAGSPALNSLSISNATLTHIPEPSLALLTSGLLGLWFMAGHRAR